MSIASFSDTPCHANDIVGHPAGAGNTLPGSSKAERRRHRHRSANYRDFPAEEDPLRPRSFVSNPHIAGLMHGSEGHLSGDIHVTSGLAGEPVVYDAQELDDVADFNPRHPPQLSEVVADAFTDSIPHNPDMAATSAPSNFSQLGLVHLGAIRSLPHRSTSTGSGASYRRGRRDSREESRSLFSSTRAVVTDEQRVTQPPMTRADSVDSASNSGSYSASGTSGSSDGPRMTFRYQHAQDAEGHHLIVGREGELTKCEEEVRSNSVCGVWPCSSIRQSIRTPGSVQGFGVLIAIEEDYDTGSLSVRQVSEVRDIPVCLCGATGTHAYSDRTLLNSWACHHHICSRLNASRRRFRTVRQTCCLTTSST